MSWFLAAAYEPFMRRSETACLSEWRHDLLAPLEGSVVEIGAGTGYNVAHYPSSVERLVLSEPDRHMLARLERASARRRGRVEIVHAGADRLPLESGAFDAVVSTLVLCSVEDVDRVLLEARRLLRPNGQLVFLEHVAADDPQRLAWQRRVEPLWRRVAGNCHLTRRTEAAIGAAGFEIVSISRESMRKALPIVRPTIRGTARIRAA